jgi:hypothetical protein
MPRQPDTKIDFFFIVLSGEPICYYREKAANSSKRQIKKSGPDGVTPTSRLDYPEYWQGAGADVTE